MMLSIIIIISLLLDAIIGELRRWHLLVGFGDLAIWFERKLNNKIIQSQVTLRVLALFDEKVTSITSLRFSLPKNDHQWTRLEKVLNSLPNALKTDYRDKITYV